LAITGNSGEIKAINADILAASKSDKRTTPSDDRMFSFNKSSLMISHEDRLISALEQLDLSVESQVTVSRPGPDVHTILLQDVYRIQSGLPLIFTSPRDWTPGQQFPSGPRRDNYGGIVFPTATVVSVYLYSFIYS
jgi:hypothetical protein